MKFRLGCQIAHEEVKPGFFQIRRWRETYSMFQFEFPRPKWGLKIFWIRCPLCNRKLLLRLTSWPIKIGSAVLSMGIYGSFALEALYLYEQGYRIPKNLSLLLIIGSCVFWLCLALSFSRGPGIMHPLGGRFGEPMHTIDHKCT